MQQLSVKNDNSAKANDACYEGYLSINVKTCQNASLTSIFVQPQFKENLNLRPAFLIHVGFMSAHKISFTLLLVHQICLDTSNPD